MQGTVTAENVVGVKYGQHPSLNGDVCTTR